MGRDFKEEYTEYMAAQTPDLWARIEAELPAKKSRKKRSLRRYVPFGVTAAVLVISVCAASFYLGTFRYGSFSGDTSKSADILWEGAADTAADGAVADTLESAEQRKQDEDTAAQGTSGAPSQGVEEPAARETKEAQTESLTDGFSTADDASGAQCEYLLQVKILADGAAEDNGWIRYRALEEESGEQVELMLSVDMKEQMEIMLQPGQTYLISAYRQEDSYLILSAKQKEQR